MKEIPVLEQFEQQNNNSIGVYANNKYQWPHISM